MSRRIFLPNYVTTLSGDDLKRYEKKIQMCGGEDPYEIVVDKWNDLDVVPNVSREDIVDFLVLKTDFYTLKQLKNHKSLDAHNYITSGHIRGCTAKLLNGKAIAFGKVAHSQSLNDEPLKCWVLLEMNGEVLTGHCNCMAGVGEVCSHVGAVLFYLELMAAKKRETTCTSQPNAWLQPATSGSTRMRLIQECDLRAAGTKWRDLLNEDVVPPKPIKRQRPQTATDEEVGELLKKAKSKGIDSAVLRIWEGLQQTQETAIPTASLPSPLGRLFDEKCAALPFSELLAHCEQVFSTISVTREEAVQLEMSTRGQQSNPIWMEHRAGRITASRMKDVCRTDVHKPSVSLVKAICYPAARKFSTVHTKRGIQDEPVILEEFARIMRQRHDDFEITRCGLVINPRYPFLGASPDALSCCRCHGGGVVEVKSIAVDKKENTGLSNGTLDRFHKFSYQIQTQLLVCKLPVGYFVEKKPNGEIHIEEIQQDAEIRSEILTKTVPFYRGAVLPELVCKYFSSERHILSSLSEYQNSRANISVCICKEPPYAPMINCIQQDCAIVTFHKKCVGISRNFKKWTCTNCLHQKALRQKNDN